MKAGPLDKKTRVRLALAVADKLNDSELGFDSTNLVLHTYGLETLTGGFSGPSVHDVVSNATDEQLDRRTRMYIIFGPLAQCFCVPRSHRERGQFGSDSHPIPSVESRRPLRRRDTSRSATCHWPAFVGLVHAPG